MYVREGNHHSQRDDRAFQPRPEQNDSSGKTLWGSAALEPHVSHPTRIRRRPGVRCLMGKKVLRWLCLPAKSVIHLYRYVVSHLRGWVVSVWVREKKFGSGVKLLVIHLHRQIKNR